jgi:pimeloyl-ACP methyl ester carboxylesterase
LAAQGYRIVAPDLRGHGRSGHVGVGGTYQLLDFLADLDLMVPQLTDQPVILVGHSLGSVIAALYASIRPQQVKTLVLIETVLPSNTPSADPAEPLLTHLDYAASPPEHAVFSDLATAASRLQRATPSLSRDFARALAERVTEPWDGGVRWRWDPLLQTRSSVSFNGAPLNRAGYLQLLNRIVAPMTLIYGDRSRFNRPQDLREQQAALPHAHRITLSGGHNIHLDAASELANHLLAVFGCSDSA